MPESIRSYMIAFISIPVIFFCMVVSAIAADNLAKAKTVIKTGALCKVISHYFVKNKCQEHPFASTGDVFILKEVSFFGNSGIMYTNCKSEAGDCDGGGTLDMDRFYYLGKNNEYHITRTTNVNCDKREIDDRILPIENGILIKRKIRRGKTTDCSSSNDPFTSITCTTEETIEAKYLQN